MPRRTEIIVTACAMLSFALMAVGIVYPPMATGACYAMLWAVFAVVYVDGGK